MENPAARLRAKWEDIKANTSQQHRGEAGVEAIVGFVEEMNEDYESHQQHEKLPENQNPQGGNFSPDNPPLTGASLENAAAGGAEKQAVQDQQSEVKDGSQEQPQGS